MRKGLSQILYVIIAASVLMMIAMVVTFTATDVISGSPEDDVQELAVDTAVEVAEDYTWKQCSVDDVFDYGDKEVWLDCCGKLVTEDDVAYRTCESVTVFRNESTGDLEVRG